MYSYANLKKNKEAIEEQKRLYRLADKNMSDKFALEAIPTLTVQELGKMKDVLMNGYNFTTPHPND